jgi:uncharacterized membrane protein
MLRLGSGPPGPHTGPPWAEMARSLGLLAAVGASLAVAARLVAGGQGASFFARNVAAAPERQGLLAALAVGAAMALGVGLILLRAGGVGALRRTAALASPLVVASLVPTLFANQAWHDQPLPYLVALGAVVITFEACVRYAQAAVPPELALRFERLAERPGARRLTRFAPLVLVLVAASGYALFTGYYSILTHRRLGTAAYDLGIYDNLMYNALHGQFFRSPVLFGPDGGNYIAGHAEFGMLLFLPLYAIAPRSETLLGLQAVLLGFAALPLYLFARTQVPRWSAAIVACVFLLYAPLHGPNFYDFHWLPLAIFFLFWFFYAVAEGKVWLGVATAVVLYLIREDVGVGLAVLGTFLLLTGARPRAGALLAVVSVAWFVVDKFVIMPRAGNWWFAELYKSLMGEGERGYGSVIRTVITNPAYLVVTLCKEAKLIYALHLFAPLAFLPLRRAALLGLALPGFFFTLMTTEYAPTVSISFQYTTHWIPYVMLAVVLALRGLAAEGGRARRRAALAAALFGTVSHSYIFGALLQHENFVGGFQRIVFKSSEVERARYAALSETIALIPRDASLAGCEHLLAHASNRMDAYTLRMHHGDAEFLLVDRTGLADAGTKKVFTDALKHAPYGLFAERGNATSGGAFYLFRRNHKADNTEAVLQSLGVKLEPSAPSSSASARPPSPAGAPPPLVGANPPGAPSVAPTASPTAPPTGASTTAPAPGASTPPLP